MRKKFNDTGLCVPDRHYMADISAKLDRIVRLIEDGQYFAINRPRQFGKTTILFLLAKRLFSEGEYLPVEISFEGLGDETYCDQKLFFEALRFSIDHFFQIHGLDDLSRFMEEHGPVETFVHLGRFISDLCKQAGKPVVLMIDEVDKSSGKQLFLDFLGLLRAKYLAQNKGQDVTFQSVVLAGIHDVKTLKARIRSVTCKSKRHVIELKIWRGPEYHRKGLKQLSDYLDMYSLDEGCLLIFDFNKNKEYRQERISFEGKRIFTVWV